MLVLQPFMQFQNVYTSLGVKPLLFLTDFIGKTWSKYSHFNQTFPGALSSLAELQNLYPDCCNLYPDLARQNNEL
jgi:hypothetical protein